MNGPKEIPERQKENEEYRYRYWEELDDSDINDEDLTKYKRVGVE